MAGYDHDGSNALVRINEDGTGSLFTGEVDLGEGVAPTLALFAAEALDIPDLPKEIRGRNGGQGSGLGT
jgi:CO/xanthine dehydrogenase Mo-binding subunit